MVDALKSLWEWLYGILKPFDVASYIEALREPLAEYMGYLNWLVPFKDILAIYTTWLVCIGAYFTFIHLRPLVTGFIKKLFNSGGG